MLTCPTCKAVNAIEDQHGERIVCISCGWFVEKVVHGLSDEAINVTNKRIGELRAVN